MASWSKHSKKTGIGDYRLNKEDYFSTAEFMEKYGTEVKIIGGYINTAAKYGAHPTLFVDTPDGVKGLSLQKSYTDQWREILADDDDRQAIINGKATGTLVVKHSDDYDTDYVALEI